MKYIFFIFTLSLSLSALANDLELIEMEAKVSEKMNSEKKEYKWKKTVKCSVRKTGSDPLYPNLGKVIYYECPDKTVSYPQPTSTGFNGWEGYCGQTAMSNITGMLCNRHMLPKTNSYYGKDSTPGQLPGTMQEALNNVFHEMGNENTCPDVKWDLKRSWDGKSFLKLVRGELYGNKNKVPRYRTSNTYVKITPVAVLLNSGGLNYHWVTVVDFIENKSDKLGCDVVVNTWGNQRHLTCENFVSYANHSGISERIVIGIQ